MKTLKIEAERRGDRVRITEIQGNFIGAEQHYRPKALVHDGSMTLIAQYSEYPWLSDIETNTMIKPGTEMSLETYEKLCSLVEQCVDAYRGHKESFAFKVAGETIEVEVTVDKHGYRVDFKIPCVHVGTRLYMSSAGNTIQVEDQSFRVAGFPLPSEYINSGYSFPDKAEFRRWKDAVLNAARETVLDQRHMEFTERHHFENIGCTVEAHGVVICGDRVACVHSNLDGKEGYTQHMTFTQFKEHIRELSKKDAEAQCVDVSRTFE